MTDYADTISRQAFTSMIRSDMALMAQVPVEFRGKPFHELPITSRMAYAELIKIPADTPFETVEITHKVIYLEEVSIPTIDHSLKISFSLEEPNALPSLSSMPKLSELKDIALLVRDNYRLGCISVQFGSESHRRFSLWVIIWWAWCQVFRKDRDQWERRMAFVREAEILARRGGPRGAPYVQAMTDAYDFLSNVGYKAPLFNSGLGFDHNTANMSQLLKVDEWASYSHMHCGLVSLRARYPDIKDDKWILHSPFYSGLVANLYRPEGDVHDDNEEDELDTTSRWWKEQPGRTLAGLAHANGNHWATYEAHLDGTLNIVDSQAVTKFPAWFSGNPDNEEPGEGFLAWEKFYKLVDPNIVMKPRLLNLGQQQDSFNCGPAALLAIHRFLNPEAPRFEPRFANCIRVQIVYDTIKARYASPFFDCPSQFGKEENVIIRTPTPSQASSSNSSRDLIDIDSDNGGSSSPRMEIDPVLLNLPVRSSGPLPAKKPLADLTSSSSSGSNRSSVPTFELDPCLMPKSPAVQAGPVILPSPHPQGLQGLAVELADADYQADWKILCSGSEWTDDDGNKIPNPGYYSSDEDSEEDTDKEVARQAQARAEKDKRFLSTRSLSKSSPAVPDCQFSLNSFFASTPRLVAADPTAQSTPLTDTKPDNKRKHVSSSQSQETATAQSDVPVKGVEAPVVKRIRKTPSEKEKTFVAAVKRGEIASYSASQFVCNCVKKGPYSLGKVAYDEHKFHQHLRSIGHTSCFVTDDDDIVIVDDSTGKVIFKQFTLEVSAWHKEVPTKKPTQAAEAWVKPEPRSKPASTPASSQSSQPPVPSSINLLLRSQPPSPVRIGGACLGLAGELYRCMFNAKHDYGGVNRGSIAWDDIAKNLFPWKFNDRVPKQLYLDCNRKPRHANWTEDETCKFSAELREAAQWRLNREHYTINAIGCCGRVEPGSKHSTCRPCRDLAHNETFKVALRRRRQEVRQREAMDPAERQRVERDSIRYTRNDYLTPSMRIARNHLSSPGVMDLYSTLEDERNPNSAVFRKLGALADEGEFEDDKTLKEILELVFQYKTRRKDPTGNAMKGIRYQEDAMNFFVVLTSRGISATGPYAAVRGVLGAPSERTVRRHVASRQTGFYVVGELDRTRVQQYVDYLRGLGYDHVPLVVTADSTSLPSIDSRASVSYVTVFADGDVAGHVIGSTLSMRETAVRSNEDLQRISARIEREGLEATQLLAVMIAAPIDGVPPRVVGLFPTSGTDTSARLLEILEETRQEVISHGMHVVGYATDGGSTERGAQAMLIAQHQEQGGERLSVNVPPYGITLEAPIVDGHPLIVIQDPEHARNCQEWGKGLEANRHLSRTGQG